MSDPVITYGNGWIEKKIGGSTSTIFISTFQVDELWVQEWIKRPY